MKSVERCTVHRERVEDAREHGLKEEVSPRREVERPNSKRRRARISGYGLDEVLTSWRRPSL